MPGGLIFSCPKWGRGRVKALSEIAGAGKFDPLNPKACMRRETNGSLAGKAKGFGLDLSNPEGSPMAADGGQAMSATDNHPWQVQRRTLRAEAAAD
jgi:hypothetical protein